MTEATTFAEGVEVHYIRFEMCYQLSEARNGSGGGGHLLAAAAAGDRGEEALVRCQLDLRVVIRGSHWCLVGGPEDRVAGVEMLLGLNQLVHEDFRATGDAGVVIVAEVKDLQNRYNL